MPEAIVAAGQILALLSVHDGKPGIVTGIHFEPGFSADPQRLVSEVSRVLEQLQDDASIHLREPWPSGVAPGTHPQVSVEADTLHVRFVTEGTTIATLELDLARPPPYLAG